MPLGDEQTPITTLIIEWKKGSKVAFDELYSVCYQQFKHEVRKHWLKHKQNNNVLDICVESTTTIVHDAYLRLSAHKDQSTCNRKDLYVLISQVVKSIIYDHYRKAASAKRAIPLEKTFFSGVEETAELYAKLLLAEKGLQLEKARCTEVLNLSVFARLTTSEIAELLNISLRTVFDDLKFAKAWYLDALNDG